MARLVAGSTPAKVRKSFIRKDGPAEVRVGVQLGFCTRYELGSLWISPIRTSATMRPPTFPSVRPSARSSASRRNVVPERRALVEAVRLQLLDVHRLRDVLPRRQAPRQLAQEVALRQ